MQGPKVFVSYSHRDREALNQLQRFLKVLERNGLVSAWADTDLEGGDDWKEEIEQALSNASVAVLLISQDFLASDFIAGQEIPKLLEREATGRLTILPVFLSPSLVAETRFPDPRSGGRETLVLSRFQGYGRPEEPLSSLSWSERDRIYGDLARRLLGMAGNSALLVGTGAPPISAPTPAAASQIAPAHAYELTIQLEDRGDTILRTYSQPGHEPIATHPIPKEEITPRLDAIHQALDNANNRALLPYLAGSPTGWGETLFDLLFSAEGKWEPVLRTVFNQPSGPRPNPIRFPVRLRIHTEDPRFSGLPWRLTSWKGQPLLDSDWTFTTTQVLDPREEPLTTAPSNVLLVLPQTPGSGGGPFDPEHEKALKDVLAKAWPTGRDPGYVRVAKTRDQLEQGLREHHPHLVYVYARGTVAEGRPSLLLEGHQGPAPYALAELRRQFQAVKQAPALLYLNTEGLHDGSGAGPLPTPDQILSGTVPLLVWRRRPEWSADSTTIALRWLQAWLGQGQNPVGALHHLQSDAVAPSCEASTVSLHSQTRDWHTTTFQTSSQRHYPSLRLDRDHQKSLVRKHLEELVRSSTRRVMALVPFASSGNSIAQLSSQLLHYLELSLASLAEIQLISLEFPPVRANLRADLEAELMLQLGAGANETPESLLRRSGPRAVPPGRKPVLFLDWGAFGADRSLRPPLEADSMEAWLRFSSEFLATHCPAELRIVSYAAVEIPTSEHEAFTRKLQEQRRQPWCRSPLFRLSEIPPLGKVAESDLLDFLEDPANSSCDAGIQQEVSERIIARTGGAFEETVALLQEAENGSWYDLLSHLRDEPGTTLPSKEGTR